MADIFPTGYFAAANALRDLNKETISNSTVLLIGCGPVGLCALLNTLDFQPKHIIAIDGVESRLEIAKKLGAEPFNYQRDMEALERKVNEYTEGRGADIVIESVGLADALGKCCLTYDDENSTDNLRVWASTSCVPGALLVLSAYIMVKSLGPATRLMGRI